MGRSLVITALVLAMATKMFLVASGYVRIAGARLACAAGLSRLGKSTTTNNSRDLDHMDHRTDLYYRSPAVTRTPREETADGV